MKKNIFLALVFLMVVSTVFAQKIEFTKTTHDFGTLYDQGGSVKYKFVFKNTGNAPLIIYKVESSCGCTTPEWTRTPILPKKEGTLMVEFEPYDNLGSVSKTITINSNAENLSVKLYIKANVEKGEKTNVSQAVH
jgi:hypothetical protein